MAVEAKLKLQIQEFNRNYTAAKNHAKAESEEMQSIGSGASSGLTSGMMGAVRAGGALATVMAVVRTGIEAVSVAVERNRARLALAAVSSDEVNSQLDRMRELAKDPALGFDQLVAGSTRLQAVGFTAERAEKTIREMGNALALVGGTKEDLDGVLLALTQIVSKGTVSAEEINQIAERLPQVRTLMKEAFGTADTTALQKMKIGADEFIDSVVTAASQLERASDSSASSISNLTDEWKNLMETLGNSVEPMISPITKMMEKALVMAGDLVEIATSIPESIGSGLAAWSMGIDGAQKRAIERVAAEKEKSGDDGAAEPIKSEATKASEFAAESRRAKMLEDSAAKSERLADEAEEKIRREREKRIRERATAMEELMGLRREVEQQAFEMLSPEEKARKMRDQLGASLGIDINGAADVERGLKSSREAVEKARASGNVDAEKAALEKLKKEQELYAGLMNSPAFGAGSEKGMRPQGEFQTLVDEIFNRDPAAEQLRAMEDSLRKQDDLKRTMDDILKKMDEPVPRDTFGFEAS